MTRQPKRVARLSSQGHIFKFKTLSLAVAACLGAAAPAVLANPVGPAVANGSATFATQGNTLTVTNSNGAIINWQQFNVGANETTRFVQPNAQSSVLNRVVGADPSQILGTLQSNGYVYLVNPNGILFGKNAVIDVPGLIASTLNLSNADFLARQFSFSGGGFGPLVNQGRISTPLGGSVMLIGSDVKNEGVITTPQGRVVLAAGNSVSLIDTAGPELSVTLTATGNKAVNLGEINAAGGRIDMFGALIEQQGVVRADSASVDEQGRIVLKATDSTAVSGTVSATNSAGQGGNIQVLGKDVTLTGKASLDASGAAGGGQVLVGGDWQGKNAAIANAQTATMQSGAVIKADATDNGKGGKVVLWSDKSTDFQGNIFARGGANGGDGGQVETSGHSLQIGGTVDTRAPKGATGFWLLDPAVLCFDVGSCSGTYDPLSRGYTSMDVSYVTPSMLDSALQSSNVYATATDYAAILPNGGVWTAGSGIPGGRSLNISAPFIYVNGTLDFRTNGARINTYLSAIGGDSVSFPNLGNTIVLDGGAKLILLAGAAGQQYVSHGFNAATIDIRNGAQIDAPYSYVTDPNYGYTHSVGESVGFQADYLFKTSGGSIRAQSVNLMFGVNGGNFHYDAAAGRMLLDVEYLGIQTQGSGGFQIGTGACATGGCWGDLSQKWSGRAQTLSFNFLGTGDLRIVGNFNPGNASYVNLYSADRLIVDAPITPGSYALRLGGQRVLVNQRIDSSGSLDIYGQQYVKIDAPVTASQFLYVGGGVYPPSTPPDATYPGVYINQPLQASYIGIETGRSGTIQLNSTLTATGAYTGSEPSSFGSSYSSSSYSTDNHNELIWIDLDGSSMQSSPMPGYAPPPATSSFVNQAGANALSVSRGFWVIAAPAGSTVDLGGMTAKQMSWADVKAGGYVPWYDPLTAAQKASEDQRNTIYTFYAAGSPTSPTTTVTDPCVLNPTLCTTTTTTPTDQTKTQTTTTTASNTTATGTTTLSAPLTIDAKLTVADSTTKSSTTTVTQTTGTLQEANLVVSKSDSAKSVAEVKAEAKIAKQEAGKAEVEARKAEAEAKKAEAEAKKAESEAKTAKTAEQKAAAKQKAEAKKAEAEAKQAEAEAKKAEAEAKKAEAEGREALAEAKSDPKAAPAAAKQAKAEAKQAEAEAKQAEAEARHAEAESKQAIVEARNAKNPDQKAVAQKTVEARKTEAEAHKAQAEAKKVEAEAKQAEAEAKTAPTPQARAAAEKKVEAKRTEAEVKKSEAESKMARAEGKQAEAQGKQSEVKAKEAQAEAKQAEAEVKAAKTPEQKQAATQKADVKKTEAEAHKSESEAKKVEAEGKKIEAEAKKVEAEAKKAEAEVKTAKTSEQKAAAEKKVEAKRAEAEVKKTEAESKQAQAESKQAEAQGKQSEVKAKEAQAEAKKAEAEMKAAKAPEEKLAATRKAEVKKTEAEAHKTESEAKKVEAEGKKIEAEAKKVEAEVKKAEAEVKTAKTPEQKAAAEKKIEVKRVETVAKKVEAEAKKVESEGKKIEAEAKMAEAEAKGTRSPGGRAVVEKQAQAKKAEAEGKKAEALVKKVEAEVKKAEAVAKKAEAEAKKVEMAAKRVEAEKKRAEAAKKAEEHRVAVEKRKEERRVEATKAFAAVVTAGANRAALQDLAALRHELKTETLKPALNMLAANPSAADLPACGGGSSVCVPVAPQQQLVAAAAAAALPPPPVPKFAAVPQIQRKVAVVVGVNKYADPSIPALESALPDAEAVGKQLQEQLGYEVRIVRDASRADIVTSLNKLSQEVGPNDSVTVYYAGHGYLSEKTKTGYWIPADAKASSPDNWISNNDVAKLLSNIPAKQVMLVSDSCYSGSLTKEQKITAAAGSLDPSGILAKRSVTVMSSGGEEPVSDEGKEGHSIFAYSLMKAMGSVKQVDSGAKLFETVRDEVSKDFPQTPQYGGAVSAGHSAGGDYLFEARSYK